MKPARFYSAEGHRLRSRGVAQLTRFITDRDLSLREVGRFCRRSAGTIHNILRGSTMPSLEVARHLRDRAGISVDAWFEAEEVFVQQIEHNSIHNEEQTRAVINAA